MAVSAEPGSTKLCINARPPNSDTLMAADIAEPGDIARSCTYSFSIPATNAGAECLKAATTTEKNEKE